MELQITIATVPPAPPREEPPFDTLPDPPPPPKPKRPSRAKVKKPLPFTIIVDTREQAPFSFGEIDINAPAGKTWEVSTLRAGLETGDYSIRGWEHLVTIERKSLEDLYGTIGGGHDRFEREHQRMREMVRRGGFAAVVVEASTHQAIEFPPAATTLTPAHLLGNWAHKSIRYGVHWNFLPSRREAELFTFRLLEAFWRQKQRELEEMF